MKAVFITFSFFLSLIINAQQWNTIGDAEFEDGVHVRDFMIMGDSLYILGTYTGINGIETTGMCIWDSSQFSAFPAVANGRTLAYYQDEVYVGGNNYISDLGFGYVAIIAFNGEEWYAPGGGGQTVVDGIEDMVIFEDKLIVCGGFNLGTLENHTLAAWDGSEWLDIGQVNGDEPDCLAIFNDELYVGGNFNSTSNGETAVSIARYGGGTDWYGVSGGASGFIKDMVVDSINNILYVGGSINAVGGNIWVDNVAAWDGTDWHSVGEIGFNNDVYTLGMYRGQLYASGAFSALSDGTPMNYISRFDGVNWQSVGGGFDGPGVAFTMVEFQDHLHIGGQINSIGGVEADDMARWYLHPDSVTWGVLDTTIDIVEQEIVNNSLRLYPNPNDGQFYVELNGTSATSGSILITDMNGRQEHYEALQGRHKLNIDISHLPSGVYLCSWVDGGALRETVRFVVN